MICHGPADDHARAQVDDGGQVQPVLVGAQVRDVSDQANARGAAVKSRPMRSSKTLSGSEGMVVRLKARIRFAAHPFSAMMAATVPTDTLTPATASLVWTMRWPKIPSEESKTVFTCSVSSRRRSAVGVSRASSQR